MSPKVSIIVPIYNASRFLERCVDSLINQTIEDIEIILVDDGSVDSSLSICQEKAAVDKRITVVSQKNRGVSVARNKGIAVSQGEFLILLDSDDWLDINTVRLLLEEQKKHDVDCVIFGFNQTCGTIWAPKENKIYNTLDELKTDFSYWLNTELLSSSVNKLYRRTLIKEYYPEDMSFGEDLLFCLNYLERCNRVSFITNPLYQHEVFNSSSLTHTFNLKRFNDIERIQRRILSFSDDKKDLSLYRKYIQDCIRIIRGCLSSDDCFHNRRDLLKIWSSQSYFSKLPLNTFELIWQNKLLLYAIQKRFYSAANLLVNWKHIIKFYK